MSRLRRAYHPAPGEAGDEVRLDREESHHLARVLRLAPGDAVGVFDGKGREWEAAVVAVESAGVRVRLGPRRSDRVEPRLDLTLFQALCRPDRLEWVIQKATEVGVSGIRLLESDRAEGRAPTPERLERWRRIAREACKQCGRRRIPPVEPPAPPPPIPEEGAGWLLTPSAAMPAGTLLAKSAPRELWLAVGPEGGFSPAEIERFLARGWRQVGLGPRVLRSETAGVVAAALALHCWGDLGAAPPTGR